MAQIPNYWPDDYLSDGTPVPAGMVNHDGVIHGWTGQNCSKCDGHGCIACAHTGEAFAPLWRMEE